MGKETLTVTVVCGFCHNAFQVESDIVEGYAQQQRERTEILRVALDEIWTKPITEQLAQQIAGNALAEWKIKQEAEDE